MSENVVKVTPKRNHFAAVGNEYMLIMSFDIRFIRLLMRILMHILVHAHISSIEIYHRFEFVIAM